MLTFIPSVFLRIFVPESTQYFMIVKNIIINSIGFLTKTLLFPNIYVNSNDIIREQNKYDKKLIISNHPSEFDFLLMCIFFTNTTLTNKNTSMVKKDIGYQIPILGFYGLLSDDIFLQRNLNQDNNKINKKLNFNSMLIYPEGTCFNNKRKIFSDNYCDNNGLMKFKFHLYPRMTGIELIMNKNKNIHQIYDLTLIYDEIIKNNYGHHYSIFNYLSNKFKIPNKIFIQTTKYKIPNHTNTNTNTNTDFDTKIIENIYLSKDNFIKKFNIYHNNFIPIKYDYLKGFGCFAIVNLICMISIYLCFKYTFIRYLYLTQLFTYYVYFLIFI
jgi:1-acyl-sn-glycerol-3-phosphate acyltransferase